MKDVRPAVCSILKSNPTVFSMVGNGKRIYPVQAPQGEVDPTIVYHRITEGADYHMAGFSGLLATRMQIDFWAQRPDLAEQLALAAEDTMSGFKVPQDGVDIQGIFVVNGREDYDGTVSLFRRSHDYEIWYR